MSNDNRWIYERFEKARPDYTDNNIAVCSSECPYVGHLDKKKLVCVFNETSYWVLMDGILAWQQRLKKQICYGWVKVLIVEIYNLNQEQKRNTETLAGYMLRESLDGLSKVFSGGLPIDSEIPKA